MAIALNNASVLRGVSLEKSSNRAVLVPPAAVWDPAQSRSITSDAPRNLPYGPSRVRTLAVNDRTQCRPEIPVSSQVSAAGATSGSRRSRSNVGNYVLGAVFGAAVFIGTVWGGLSIDSEVDSASTSSTTTVVSSR